jgi:hypothetical protein
MAAAEHGAYFSAFSAGIGIVLRLRLRFGPGLRFRLRLRTRYFRLGPWLRLRLRLGLPETFFVGIDDYLRVESLVDIGVMCWHIVLKCVDLVKGEQKRFVLKIRRSVGL